VSYNQRGTAIRDQDKSIRIKTHIPVIERCLIEMSERITIIEHGMGIGSTPFFHSQNKVKSIISFENDHKWNTCSLCGSDSKLHIIKPFIEEDLDNIFSQYVNDVSQTLALIDGPTIERSIIFKYLINLSIPFIVEHDVEWWDATCLNSRITHASLNGYTTFQYVRTNPESALFLKSDIQLDQNFVSLKVEDTTNSVDVRLDPQISLKI